MYMRDFQSSIPWWNMGVNTNALLCMALLQSVDIDVVMYTKPIFIVITNNVVNSLTLSVSRSKN
jgi:hypothetical protein